MNKLIFLIIACLISSSAQAKFILSGSEIYSQYSDKTLKIPSTTTHGFSYGYFTKYDNVTFSFSSNRLIQKKDKTLAVNKNNNQSITLKSKYTIDSINFGYQLNNKIIGLTLANVKAERKFNSFNTTKHAILYGINYSFILKNNLLLTFTLIAPNKELSLKGAGIAGINFLF